MVLGDAVTKLETFVWILNHVSRSITWSLFNLKESNLVKRSTSMLSVMSWCQFIDYFKFQTRPSSLLNFGTAYRDYKRRKTETSLKKIAGVRIRFSFKNVYAIFNCSSVLTTPLLCIT